MDICIIGLGSMGFNLTLNIISKGYQVTGFDKNSELLKKLKLNPQKRFIVCNSLKKVFTSTSSQRLVLISLPSYEIDKCISQIIKYLDKNDIIADLGNSFFKDTKRRFLKTEKHQLLFLGIGVSGGPNGARNGPAIMAGGSKLAWTKVKSIFYKICSKNESYSACVFFGNAENGHFIKMIHNAIEYAFMQILAETCTILDKYYNFNPEEQKKFLSNLSETAIGCYLVEITSKIISAKYNKKYIINLIDSHIEQNGTGNWSIQTSLDLGVSIPTIYTAVSTRLLSKSFRQIKKPELDEKNHNNKLNITKDLYNLILFNFLCSIFQGFNIITEANKKYKFNINLNDVFISWSSGSILRGNFLNLFHKEFVQSKNFNLNQLKFLVNKKFKIDFKNLRKMISICNEHGIPTPVLSSSLSYFDTIFCSHKIGEITQLQRSFFGQHPILNKNKKKIIVPKWNKNEQE